MDIFAKEKRPGLISLENKYDTFAQNNSIQIGISQRKKAQV